MEEWRERLEPFGHLYLGMIKGIKGYLYPMSDEQLIRVCEDCKQPNRGNCGWTTYRIAPLVSDIAAEILMDRNREKEATHEDN